MKSIQILEVTAEYVIYMLDGNRIGKRHAEFANVYPPSVYGKPKAGAIMSRPDGRNVTLTRRW